MTISERHDKQIELRNHIRKFMYDLVNAAPSRESWVPGENINYDTDLCVIVYNKRYGFLGRKKSELYLEIYDDLRTGFCFNSGDRNEEPVISVLKPKDLFERLNMVGPFFFKDAKGDKSNLIFPRETPKVPDLSSFVTEN